MLVLLCAFILTACSSTPGYNEQLESWVGVSEEHLVDNWGMPDSTFTLDADTRVLTYVEYDGEGDREVYSEQIYYPAISGQNFPGPNPDGEILSIAKFPLPSTTALSPVTILTATTVRENCCRAVQTSTQA